MSVVKNTFAASAILLGLGMSPAYAVGFDFTGFADGGNTVIDSNSAPVTSTIVVLHDLTITDINVEVNLEHSFLGDLTIDLTGPDSTTIRLMGDDDGSPTINFDGGGGDDLVMTLFDDEAATSIITDSSVLAPFTGSFSPREALSVFDGTSSAGSWTLTVTDNVVIDTGTFGDWTIFFNGDQAVDVVEPATLGLLGLGLVGFAATRRRTR